MYKPPIRSHLIHQSCKRCFSALCNGCMQGGTQILRKKMEKKRSYFALAFWSNLYECQFRVVRFHNGWIAFLADHLNVQMNEAPDRIFRNFRASKSGDQHFWTTYKFVQQLIFKFTGGPGPNWPLHKFEVSKSVVQRFWTTPNSQATDFEAFKLLKKRSFRTD